MHNYSNPALPLITAEIQSSEIGFRRLIGEDLRANRNNTKGKTVLILYRFASLVASGKTMKFIFFPYLIFYKLIVEWVLGIELPWHLKAGPGLKLYHGQGTVINRNVTIGSNCVIRHSTTIGNAREGGNCPVIGNNVDIGCHVCIIGDIQIGNNVIIGAGSVVVKNIPSNVVVAGNPARIIKNF